MLDGLSTLQTLDLSYTRVIDAGLKHVKGVKGLKRLALDTGPMSMDEGLKDIVGLTDLEDLFLAQTAVTDRGLENLKGLTKLERVGTGPHAGRRRLGWPAC